jgi:hypothetical protein
MKKLLTALSVVLCLGFASAQKMAPARGKSTVHMVKQKTVKKEAKTKPAPAGVKMKKDGTPDKRYKNAKHLKKDGTVDKRFKK